MELAAKIETTPGTLESLSGTEATFKAFDVSITPDIDMTPRQGQRALSQMAQIVGGQRARVAFRTEVHGDGSAGIPAWGSILLPGVGMKATSQTYGFDSDYADTKALSFGHYVNGHLFNATGCMGSVTFNFVSGEIATADWEYMGCWVAETDSAMITPTKETVLPPRFAGATLTVGSYSPFLSNLSIRIENEVVVRPDAHKSTGYLASIITGRRIIITMDPELELDATYDLDAALNASTEAALSLVIGSANNRVTFSAPKLQWVEHPISERNGIATRQISAQCNRNSDAGDDELTIAFD